MALDKETLNQFIDSIRRYVRDRLVPLEMQVAEEDHIPEGVIEEMKEMGLFGLSIPEEFGGLGLTMSEEVAIIQEMGYTSPVFRSMFGQRRHWFPRHYHRRHSRTESKVPSETRLRRTDWFICTDGSGRRFRCGFGRDDGKARRRRIRHQWQQTL